MLETTPIPASIPLHWATAVCFLTGAILAGRRRDLRPALTLIGLGAVFLSIHLLLMVVTLRRLPLYGGYETLTILLWTPAILMPIRSQLRKDRLILVLFGLVGSGLCLVMVMAPLNINHDYFMYANIWVQGFFFCKLLSAGVIATVALVALTGLLPGRIVFDQSLFMAGTVFFLASELSGSIWCLLGWGDSWHWSGNFFQSMLIFFVFMLNLHLPPGWYQSKKGALTALHLFSPLVIVGLLLW